eukprot:CAMPEP_0114331908 /NCGR_PEP_ID=MMETSP0101-20121206/2730_1 /TAXON_ID=38822 ORGANISM="Pteridomonas danica, Strain PT" /NCGR_SAMPLE_ID=MMETSP0101 /ASSEMBLY_ACC=CAM_ASM_000211 /LENGTH=363 /DNA_ID=CAMNT_0001462407 /DNA_START=24 /DNA_END=1112 /DNA_ORIENTATION=+
MTPSTPTMNSSSIVSGTNTTTNTTLQSSSSSSSSSSTTQQNVTNQIHPTTNQQLISALACLDNALELGKECQAYILRGKVNWALGQIEAGNRDFRSAALLSPGHPEVVIFQNMMFSEAGNLYSDAKRAMENKDFDEAVSSLNLAIKAAPEDVRLVVMRATVLRRMGCLEDAFVDLDRAARMYFIARYDYQDSELDSPEEALLTLNEHMAEYPEHLREPLEVTRQRNLTANEAAKNDHASALVMLDRTIQSEKGLVAAQMNHTNNSPSRTSRGGGVQNNTETMKNPSSGMMPWNQSRDTQTTNSFSHSKQQLQQQKPLTSLDVKTYGVDIRFLINRGDCRRALGDLNGALSDFNAAYEVDPQNW